jgi:uncharacterized protein (TIGR03435 family)
VAAGAQTFDVASVKPAAPYKGGPIHIGVSGGPGTDDPGRIVFSNATIRMILLSAFDVQSYQIEGPEWINQDMFDITASVPEGAAKEHVQVMVRNLLAERFQMSAHVEKRDLPSYVLTVGKGGPRMNVSVAPDPPPRPKTTTPAPGISKLTCVKCPVAQFVSMLGNPLGRPIFDETGLTAKYDFTLTWQPEFRARPGMDGPLPPSEAARDPFAESAQFLPAAVQEQLGLKLELKKVPTDMVVIDRIERTPSAN